MSQLCAGWDVATVREIVADTLHNIVDPLVYDEAVSLIEEHQLAGRDVVIVSDVRLRGGRADRRDARRRPGGRDPDGDRRTASTPARSSTTRTPRRRPRAIRELAEQRGYDLDELLRLQRLGHRRAHARGRRPPARRQPRPGAAPGRAPPGLAGAGVHQAGGAAEPGAAARRPSRPSPRSPSAASWPSAACCGPTPGERRSAPEPRTASAGESQPLNASPDRRTNGAAQLHRPAREPGTHAAIYPSYRALVTGNCPGQQLEMHAW